MSAKNTKIAKQLLFDQLKSDNVEGSIFNNGTITSKSNLIDSILKAMNSYKNINYKRDVQGHRSI